MLYKQRGKCGNNKQEIKVINRPRRWRCDTWKEKKKRWAFAAAQEALGIVERTKLYLKSRDSHFISMNCLPSHALHGYVFLFVCSFPSVRILVHLFFRTSSFEQSSWRCQDRGPIAKKALVSPSALTTQHELNRFNCDSLCIFVGICLINAPKLFYLASPFVQGHHTIRTSKHRFF